MRVFKLSILLLCIYTSSFAQKKEKNSIQSELIVTGNEPEYPIVWNSQPKITIPTETEKDESAVIILNQIRYELHINPISDKAIMYYTLHNIIHLNDDKAVESFNKIELPSAKENKFASVKARTIKPNGTIIELKESDIRENTDDQGRVYRVFAIDGLEKNSDIEYMYTIELPSINSNRDILQYSIPVRKAQFELFHPKYLVYEAKGYNGIETKTIDTNAEYNLIQAISENIPGIEEEKYSYRSNYLKRVEFSLAFNKRFSSVEKLNSWQSIANKIGEVLFPTPNEVKSVKAYLEKQKEFKTQKTEVEKIIWIENHFKESIKITDDASTNAPDEISYVLKNAQATEIGMNRIMLAGLQSQEIDAQLVLTCNKVIFPFDKKMPTYRSTTDALIYLPSTKQFIMPTAVTYRYPLIPIIYANTDGLLMRVNENNKNGDILTDFVHTTTTDGNYSAHNIDAIVDLNLQELNAKVNYTHTLKGHGANSYRPYFVYSNKEQQNELFKTLLSLGNEKEDIYENTKVENSKLLDGVNNSPLVLSADITTNAIMEKAGNQYLFKLGKLIGKQAEMYQEKVRQTDIDIDYTHHLYRNLSIKIPEGYTPKSLDKLNMNVASSNKDYAFGFKSNYKIENGNIVVNIDEWYLTEKMPKTLINEFRDVINAAADFEKVVIGFEKK